MTTLLLLALALAMDAFAVALAQGAATRPGVPDALRIGLAFGAAQAVMPLFGWSLGRAFAGPIAAIDHWVAFVLLGAIGARMIHQGLRADAPDVPVVALSGKALLFAAIATSVDAAAAGVTLPTIGVPVGIAAATIGAVTAPLCFAATLLGARIGDRLGNTAEIGGGLVLIGLGGDILARHMGWLGGTS